MILGQRHTAHGLLGNSDSLFRGFIRTVCRLSGSIDRPPGILLRIHGRIPHSLALVSFGRKGVSVGWSKASGAYRSLASAMKVESREWHGANEACYERLSRDDGDLWGFLIKSRSTISNRRQTESQTSRAYPRPYTSTELSRLMPTDKGAHPERQAHRAEHGLGRPCDSRRGRTSRNLKNQIDKR
jgi:hypothetical protein